MSSLSELDQYVSGRSLALGSSAKALLRSLRTQLIDASNARKISTSPHDVHRILRFFEQMHPNVADEVRARGLGVGAFSITGGEKNQGRSRDVEHFERNDGAWFDFTLTGRLEGDGVTLLAYDFEIRLAPGCGAPFLRFDLNLPGHRNEERDLRCHVHCGSDDVLLPVPLMSPVSCWRCFSMAYGWQAPDDHEP